MKAASLQAGMSSEYVRKLIAGSINSPTYDVAQRLARVFDVNAQWLLDGSGDRAAPDRPMPAGDVLEILGDVAGGVWFEAEANEAAHDSGHVLPDPRFPAKAQYLLRARGTSVNRVIEEGDLVHCVDLAAAGQKPRDGDMVVVERVRASGEREVSAKRYRLRDDGNAELRAESHEARWKDYVLALDGDDGDEIRIAAIIVKKLREFR